jgi:tetratricopeptide (TPR) repeat protein
MYLKKGKKGSNGLKRYDEALECSNKALDLDPNSIPPNWYTS